MKKITYLFLSIPLLLFVTCKGASTAKINNSIISKEIVLINVENVPREAIGDFISKLDSCKPKVIGVDVFFVTDKGKKKDSVLVESLKNCNNDVLAYFADENKEPVYTNSKFTNYATSTGISMASINNGLEDAFCPFEELSGETIHISL